MLSKSTKYAMKAVLYLGLHSSKERKILAKEISDSTFIPKAYLSKILQDLSRHNIVSAIRGPGGGFYLSDENRVKHVVDIIHIMDGDEQLKLCVLGIKQCNAEHPCPMHHMVGKTKSSFIKCLEEVTVEELIKDIEAGKSFLPL